MPLDTFITAEKSFKMPKKRIINSEEINEFLEAEKPAPTYAEGGRLAKKFKNSLDSDEEDDEQRAEKYNVLNPDEFDGQEESTIDHDGEIRIMPFNMKEEMEEGYFDKDGTYIFKKEDEIEDKWLDNIDWVKVKETSSKFKENVPSSDSEDEPHLDVTSHYKEMLTIMEPKETVQKAICRLGGSSKQSSRSIARKKVKSELPGENKEKLDKLTSLANDIVQSGDMDIYQRTYERLSFLVKASAESKLDSYSAEGTSDMFSDQFDNSAAKEKSKTAAEFQEATQSLEDEVTWEFKWEKSDEATVYGPHSTSEMLQWVQEGYFNEDVCVRQVGKMDSQFYSAKRIDFELYL